MSMNWNATTNMRQLNKEFEQYFWSPYSQEPEAPVSHVARDLAQSALIACLFTALLGLFAWWMFR